MWHQINSSKIWYDCEEDRIKGRWADDGENQRVYIGSDPTWGMTRIMAEKFAVFINVSDSPCNTFNPVKPDHLLGPQKMYWYPINEYEPWGYGPFFWANRILYYHIGRGELIYLHCQAGMHRSPTVFLMYLYYKGYSLRQAVKMVRARETPLKTLRVLRKDLEQGLIPKNIFKFAKLMSRYSRDWPLCELQKEAEA